VLVDGLIVDSIAVGGVLLALLTSRNFCGQEGGYDVSLIIFQ